MGTCDYEWVVWKKGVLQTFLKTAALSGSFFLYINPLHSHTTFPRRVSHNFASIETAIATIKAGRMLIAVDDEQRENEGDLICAAQTITAEQVNFMATHARGLICAPITTARADELNFYPMVADADPNACNFAVSVDLRAGDTGISVNDRAQTMRRICADDAAADEFERPGHVFPLRAKAGGVLERAGHTEAATDLCALAGLKRAAVICEIANTDGSMSRLPRLQKFAAEHDLPLISIADLIAYRCRTEQLVEIVDTQTMTTASGELTITTFRETSSDTEHIALSRGDFAKIPTVRVRRGSPLRDLLGDAFATLPASAVLVYLHSSAASSAPLTVPPHHELKQYGVGAQILRALGVTQMRLLTHDTQTRLVGLEGYGLEIVEMVALKK